MSRVPLLPLMLVGARLPLRMHPPATGEHTDALLREAGYAEEEIAALRQAKVIG